MSSYLFSELDAGATYKVTACAEMSVDDSIIKSAVISEEVLICKSLFWQSPIINIIYLLNSRNSDKQS